MPYNLKGRNVLITGGSRGLGVAIAEKFAAQGCNVSINYNASQGPAEELATRLKTEYAEQKFITLKADCGVTSEINALVKSTVEGLGGLDIVIGNAGWTKFSEFGDLNALDDDDWDKCWSVNVRGQMALFRAALPTLNANEEGGVFITTASIAGTSLAGSSMAYSVTKAAQIHLIRCLANTQGPKVRVNSVLPGLLLTEWGRKYSEEQIEAIKQRAVLKSETKLDDCADAYVSLAQNTSMTGQRITVDAGVNVAGF